MHEIDNKLTKDLPQSKIFGVRRGVRSENYTSHYSTKITEKNLFLKKMLVMILAILLQ